jgi:hypothetical protein
LNARRIAFFRLRKISWSQFRFIDSSVRNGHSIVVRGRVDAEALSRVIDLLVQR